MGEAMTTLIKQPQTQDFASLRRAWPALVALSLTFLVEMIDNTVLNVALPTIGRSLDASATQLQWVTGVYALTFGGLMLPFGALADRVGRKRIMLLGLLILALSSLSVLAVRTSGQLIAVRAATGIAAAMTAPGTMALAFRLFPDDSLRRRASALITSVGMVGLAAGPVVSGVLLEVAPWRVLLLINVPVAVLAFVGVWLGIPDDTEEGLSRDPIDWLGAALVMTAMVAGTYFLTRGAEVGWASGQSLALIAVAVLAALAFVARERTAWHPMLDLGLVRTPAVTAGLLNQVGLAMSMIATTFLMTLHLQTVWGWTPLLAGVAGLPRVVAMVGSAPLVDRVAKRFGFRTAGLGGGLVVAGAVVLYALLARHGYVWMALATVGMTAGMRVVMISSAIAVMRSLPPDKTSTGSALSDTSQEVGNNLGVAVAGTTLAVFVGNRLGSAPAAGFVRGETVACLIVAAAAALMTLAAYRVLRPHPDTAPAA
jgi:EmrB/QacA subfamily drug resistance transporter